MRDSLTFDCLLNTISGVKNGDGVLLCVTTNSITDLDPALGIPNGINDSSTRPGRIDRAVELVDMQEPERRKVANYILKDCSVDIEQLLKNTNGETAAQFQSRCTSLALSQFWKTNKLNKD
jgi:ATP-dependent 26S proteasome regulatory subunit